MLTFNIAFEWDTDGDKERQLEKLLTVPVLKIISSKFPIPKIFPAGIYSIPSGYCPISKYRLSIVVYVTSFSCISYPLTIVLIALGPITNTLDPLFNFPAYILANPRDLFYWLGFNYLSPLSLKWDFGIVTIFDTKTTTGEFSVF
jgi:hypothetical protein